MTVQTKPAIYYFVDELGNNQHPDPSNIPATLGGYPDESIPAAKEYNTFGRGAGLWHRWFDQNALTAVAALSTVDAKLSKVTDRVAYTTGAGMTQSLSSGGYYLVKGKMVDATVARLTALNLSPYDFTDSSWTHVYLKADGEVVHEVVAPGIAASPNGTRIWVGTAKADAVNVTDWVDGLSEPPRVGQAWGFENGLRVHSIEDVPSTLEFYMAESSQWRLKHSGSFGNTVLAVENIIANVPTSIFSFGNQTTPMSFTRRITATINTGLTNPLLSLTQSAANGRVVQLNSNGGHTLKLVNSGITGSPLVIYPKSPVTTADEIGSMHPAINGNFEMMYRAANGEVRRMWATTRGLITDTGVNVGGAATAIAVNVVSKQVSMNNTALYWVFTHVRVGRTIGSTRNVLLSGTVGGQHLWWSPTIVELFQSGNNPYQLEQTFTAIALMSPPAPALMTVVLNVAPTGGAGSVCYGTAGMHVLGAFD